MQEPSRRKALTYTELCERFGASFDEHKLRGRFDWYGHELFKKEMAVKLPHRCKYVRSAWVRNGVLYVQFNDVSNRSEGTLMGSALYEMRRIVDGTPQSSMKPREFPGGKQHYINTGRKLKGRGKRTRVIAPKIA